MIATEYYCIIIIILMGAIQAKFFSNSKESDLPSDFGDTSQVAINPD